MPHFENVKREHKILSSETCGEFYFKLQTIYFTSEDPIANDKAHEIPTLILNIALPTKVTHRLSSNVNNDTKHSRHNSS